MFRIIILLLVFLIFSTEESYAAPPSVYSLLEDCRAVDGSVERSYCLLYLVGFADGFVAGGGGGREVCLPRGIRVSQIRQAFIRWAVGHPQYSGWRPSRGMREALKSAYPCYTAPDTYSD